MLKNILERILFAPDANTDGSSSALSDDKGADSSQQQQSEQEQQDEGEESQESDADGKESDTDATGDEGQQADDQQDGQQSDESQQAQVALDKPEDAQLPFHKHTRFQEVVTQKNEALRQFETSKPLVEQANTLNNILRENGISGQEFQSALQYLIALRKDPTAAYRMLKPTYEQLAMFSGDRLPEDLEAKVAAGTLDRETAIEVGRARAQQKYTQVQQSWQQDHQADSFGSLVKQTTSIWEESKMQTDPDFRPGLALYKQTDLVLRSFPPPKSIEEARQNCEKAYTEAKTFISGFRKVSPVRGSPQVRQTGANGRPVIKSAMDALKAVQAGLRPGQVNYE